MINRNGGAFLRDALRTCRIDLEETWQFRQDFELLVIDNGSTDDSLLVIATELASASFKWRIVEELIPGVNSARNTGLREAIGDFLIFVDSDLRFHAGWLVAYLEAEAIYPKVEVFAGHVQIGLVEGEVPDWLDLTGPWKRSCIVVQADFGKDPAVFPLTADCGPVGPNMAFRRSIFERAGIFDIQFGLRPGSLIAGAEAEFFDRLSCLGVPFAWVPEAIVDHPLKRQQISRQYFLDRLHGIGRVSSRIAWIRKIPAKQVFGLTLYHFPKLFRTALIWLRAVLWGDSRQIFYYRGQISILLGYFHEDFIRWWTAKRASLSGKLDS